MLGRSLDPYLACLKHHIYRCYSQIALLTSLHFEAKLKRMYVFSIVLVPLYKRKKPKGFREPRSSLLWGSSRLDAGGEEGRPQEHLHSSSEHRPQPV